MTYLPRDLFIRVGRRVCVCVRPLGVCASSVCLFPAERWLSATARLCHMRLSLPPRADSCISFSVQLLVSSSLFTLCRIDELRLSLVRNVDVCECAPEPGVRARLHYGAGR